jgi:NADH-quinone oxidoreductase subunit M
MPVLAFFFILFTFSSVGLPGLNGFVSEFLTILGAFTSVHLAYGVWYGSFAALGIILGAVYMLHMAARVIWGPLMTPEVHEEHVSGTNPREPHAHHTPGDIGAREIAILVPLALAVVLLGVYPSGLLRSLEGPVKLLQQPVPEAAQAAARARANYLAQMQSGRPTPISTAMAQSEAREAAVP